MANKLTLRSKNSPFIGAFSDINLGSVLDHVNLDDNFIYLKGNIIYTGTTSATTLTMHKIDGTNINVDLSGLVDAGDTFLTGFTVNENTYTIVDNSGNTYNATWTGNTSGSCIEDLHVSNIHSCSPLFINPSDEGNIYFGGNSGFTVQINTGDTRIGINKSNPSFALHVETGHGYIKNGALGIGESPDVTQRVRITQTDVAGNNTTGLRVDHSYQTSTGSFSALQVRSVPSKSGSNSNLFGINALLGGNTSSVTSGTHTFIAGRFKTLFAESGGTVNQYALQLEDGTEGTIGHVLTSVSTDGKTGWGAIGSSSIIGDTFVSGATLNGLSIDFDKNDTLSAFTVDLSPLVSAATTLSGLTDTSILTPSDGDHLIYSGGVWFNREDNDIYFTASTNGQTIFNGVLPTTPLNIIKTKMYVNGVKQRYGLAYDFTITGGTDVVWTSSKHTIDITDELEIIYL